MLYLFLTHILLLIILLLLSKVWSWRKQHAATLCLSCSKAGHPPSSLRDGDWRTWSKFPANEFTSTWSLWISFLFIRQRRFGGRPPGHAFVAQLHKLSEEDEVDHTTTYSSLPVPIRVVWGLYLSWLCAFLLFLLFTYSYAEGNVLHLLPFLISYL